MERCPECMNPWDGVMCAECGYRPVDYVCYQGALQRDSVLINRFHIFNTLDRSRQALIYAAWDTVQDQPVLIAELFPGTAFPSPSRDDHSGDVIVTENQALFRAAMDRYKQSRPEEPLPLLETFFAHNTVYRVYTLNADDMPVKQQAELLADHPILFRDEQGNPVMTITCRSIPPLPEKREYVKFDSQKRRKKYVFILVMALILALAILGGVLYSIYSRQIPKADSIEQTAEPPIEQTAEPPIEQTAEPPIEQTAEPPIEQTAEPPIEQTAEPPIEQTVEPPIEQTARLSIEQTAEPPIEQPTEEPEAEPTKEPAARQEDKPEKIKQELHKDGAEVKQPTVQPAAQPERKTTEQPTEQRAERPEEQSAEKSEEETFAKQGVEETEVKSAEHPETNPKDAPADESIDKPEEESTEQSAGQSTESPTAPPTVPPKVMPTVIPTMTPATVPIPGPMEIFAMKFMENQATWTMETSENKTAQSATARPENGSAADKTIKPLAISISAIPLEKPMKQEAQTAQPRILIADLDQILHDIEENGQTPLKLSLKMEKGLNTLFLRSTGSTLGAAEQLAEQSTEPFYRHAFTVLSTPEATSAPTPTPTLTPKPTSTPTPTPSPTPTPVPVSDADIDDRDNYKMRSAEDVVWLSTDGKNGEPGWQDIVVSATDTMGAETVIVYCPETRECVQLDVQVLPMTFAVQRDKSYFALVSDQGSVLAFILEYFAFSGDTPIDLLSK